MHKVIGQLCPKIRKILSINTASSTSYGIKWNGGDGYEVSAHGKVFVVDIQAKKCSCGLWQLSGIPCSHSIQCLNAAHKSLNDTVQQCYHRSTFMSLYSNILNPVASMDQWDSRGEMPLDPPHVIRLSGRPKVSRVRAEGEVRKVGKKEVLRRWTNQKCGWCTQDGHNQTTCKEKAAGKPQVQVARQRRAADGVQPPNAYNDIPNVDGIPNADDVPNVDDVPNAVVPVARGRGRGRRGRPRGSGRGSYRNLGGRSGRGSERGAGRGRTRGRGRPRGSGRGTNRRLIDEEETGEHMPEPDVYHHLPLVEELDGVLTQEDEVMNEDPIPVQQPDEEPAPAEPAEPAVQELADEEPADEEPAPEDEDSDDGIEIMKTTFCNTPEAQSVRREHRRAKYWIRRKSAMGGEGPSTGFKKPRNI